MAALKGWRSAQDNVNMVFLTFHEEGQRVGIQIGNSTTGPYAYHAIKRIASLMGIPA